MTHTSATLYVAHFHTDPERHDMDLSVYDGAAYLDDIRETCESLATDADLHRPNGERAGWVHRDGTWSLV